LPLFKFRAEWLQNNSILSRDSSAIAERAAYLNDLKNRASIMRESDPRHAPDSVRVFDAQGTALGTFQI
jgi:hypothetical protein